MNELENQEVEAIPETFNFDSFISIDPEDEDRLRRTIADIESRGESIPNAFRDAVSRGDPDRARLLSTRVLEQGGNREKVVRDLRRAYLDRAAYLSRTADQGYPSPDDVKLKLDESDRCAKIAEDLSSLTAKET